MRYYYKNKNDEKQLLSIKKPIELYNEIVADDYEQITETEYKERSIEVPYS